MICVGTKRIPNLEENFGALKVKLSKEEVEELTNIIPADEVRTRPHVIGLAAH